MSKIPLLQVALDTLDLDTALKTTRKVHDVVDRLIEILKKVTGKK